MITYPTHLPQLHEFAIPKLQAALDQLGISPAIGFGLDPACNLPPESFQVRSQLENGKPQITVSAPDPAGLMYGALDLAEQLLFHPHTSVPTYSRGPHVPFRALKFNLPWSAYRWGEVMTQHIETCRTQAFWAALIDMLAENRFNVLSLWNLHPFPFMFRPRSFSEACDLSDADLASYQALFRFIFRRCHERSIRPYILFWNIFVSDAFAKAHGLTFLDEGPEYHFGPGDTSELVARYTRECVTQLIDDYPDLAGIGIATGDRMQNFTPLEREQWVEANIIPAIKASTRPDIDFIHRAPFTQQPQDVRNVLDRSDLPGQQYVEFKFNWSHAHSTPRLCMTHDESRSPSGAPGATPMLQIDDRFWNPPPTSYKVLWMARNEDIWLLRWGQPDFIREHITTNTGPDKPWAAGYFVGSEGYIPAKEFAQINPPHQYAFQRQWLFYMLWGRLLYDPSTPDDVFALAFDRRYAGAMPGGAAGRTLGKVLLDAYRAASNVPLLLASFHAATWDYTLYAEGFLAPFKSLGRHDGCPFINILELIDHRPLDPHLLSTEAFVRLPEVIDLPPDMISPLQLANRAERDAAVITEALNDQRFRGASPFLAAELADLAAWRWLHFYFAAKLRAAVSLERCNTVCDSRLREGGIAYLQTALDHWRALAELTSRTYHRVPYIDRPRQGYRLDFHWADFLPAVERDIELARAAMPEA